MYPFFVCALGDFLVLFVPVLRQIARYLPPHRTKNDSKTHPRSSHDKFKTASNFVDKEIITLDLHPRITDKIEKINL